MGHKEFKREIADREQALLEYSMKLVNDRTKAEMLVQETLNLAIEECKKHDGCENLNGRLLSIMHNIFLKGKNESIASLTTMKVL